jgi:signal transduction histidine kinase
VEAGKEPLQPEMVDGAAIARTVAELFEPQAQSKHLEMQVQIPDAPVMLFTDPTKLRQILINVIGNAMKFTEAGEVDIVVGAQEDRVCFTVRDTGPGMTPEDLERIFDPFTQLDQSLTRSKGGTGLGLPVSRKLAHLLDGDLIVTSAPDVGTTFTLWLPIVAEPKPGLPPSVMGVQLLN